ncbi:putative alpha-amylase [Pseudovirgaria hyperparasitica]|uniref:alpha-amylase n=1 Tax=Pseudovirgaria hyperparasitica TaxID=470096 RepID=A0A6A6W5R8_9PEZI|nr:putative alpha-amylase [Pseudovirgaria hyperparasitica]KAF2757290.1 putative alpha-amylase [Pseudovirgaria hyperparasitica]
MGWAGAADTVDDSIMNPFNDATYYHSYCNVSNWQDQTQVELCWLGDPKTILMPDLKTEDSNVRSMFGAWISKIVSDYSIDGLRIDSVKNVETGFWSSFCASAGILCFGEVSDGNYAYAYPYMQYIDAITDYPMYYSITRVFQQQTDMSDIVYNLGLCKDGGCKDTTMAFSFIENHDNARFPAGTSDLALAKNAIAYTMLGDGVPIVYQGQESHLAGGDDPGCREAIWLQKYNTNAELYKHIALLNQIRNSAMLATPASGYPGYAQYQNWVLTYSSNVIQMRKDPVRTVLSNEGSSVASYTLTTSGMGFTTGANVVEVLTCNVYVADATGNVALSMGQGRPSVLMSEAQLQGTGLCGH